jgi:hypothetical protein
LTTESVKDLVIVGIDIAQYSLKPLAKQKAAQMAIDHALSDAIRNCGFGNREKREWLDGGDGGYALFGWSSGREVLDVIKEFTEAVRRSNDDVPDLVKVSVRVALHRGKVLCWKASDRQKRFTSDAINECARFLAGMARDPGRIVCSRAFLDHISGISEVATATRLHDVVDKHGIPHEIFNLHVSPGLGLLPDPHDLHENQFR